MPSRTHDSTSDRSRKVLEIVQAAPGVTSGQIIDRLDDGSNRNQVSRVLSHLMTTGQVKRVNGKYFPA